MQNKSWLYVQNHKEGYAMVCLGKLTIFQTWTNTKKS